jgi:hypothetical protein
LATAVFEHAGSTVALAGALYVAQKYTEAAEAYKKALEVRKGVWGVEATPGKVRGELAMFFFYEAADGVGRSNNVCFAASAIQGDRGAQIAAPLAAYRR